jgi:anti-sigma regulatory factor (Ser/Thr protein kinase)
MYTDAVLPGHIQRDEAFETAGFHEYTPTADSVAEARHFVGDILTARNFGTDHIFGCQLVADEFATNALVHAGTFFSVAVEIAGDRVRVAVRDDSGAFPVLRESSLESLEGRGLSIVAKESEEWGSDSLGLGKETWAEVISTPTR